MLFSTIFGVTQCYMSFSFDVAWHCIKFHFTAQFGLREVIEEIMPMVREKISLHSV